MQKAASETNADSNVIIGVCVGGDGVNAGASEAGGYQKQVRLSVAAPQDKRIYYIFKHKQVINTTTLSVRNTRSGNVPFTVAAHYDKFSTRKYEPYAL